MKKETARMKRLWREHGRRLWNGEDREMVLVWHLPTPAPPPWDKSQLVPVPVEVRKPPIVYRMDLIHATSNHRLFTVYADGEFIAYERRKS
jgi:hypothetical protein